MNAARIVVVALLAAALTACGAPSEGPQPGTVPPPITATDTSAGAGAETPGAGTAAPTGGAVTRTVTATAPPTRGTPIAADPPEQYRASGGGAYFFTPSRNIACGLDSTTVGCQVFKTAVLPPGADCDHGTMPRDQLSKGYFSQAGGPFTPSCFNQGLFFMVVPDQKTLPYGHSITAGGMTCTSEERGVTCRRGEDGFFVSAQGFDRW